MKFIPVAAAIGVTVVAAGFSIAQRGPERITVLYDHHGVSEGGSNPHPVIVTQTAEDMRYSNYRPAYGWIPSANDLYLKHPRVTTHTLPAPERRRVRVAAIHPRETYHEVSEPTTRHESLFERFMEWQKTHP